MTYRKGFTLIEMLIVIAIIGILATLVLVGLGPVQRQGRDARRVSDLRQVENALALYYNQNGNYPQASDWSNLQSKLKDAAGDSITHVDDPSFPARDYAYGTDGSGTVFVLGAYLEVNNNSVMRQSLTNWPNGISGWSFAPIGWSAGQTCGDQNVGIYCISL